MVHFVDEIGWIDSKEARIFSQFDDRLPLQHILCCESHLVLATRGVANTGLLPPIYGSDNSHSGSNLYDNCLPEKHVISSQLVDNDAFKEVVAQIGEWATEQNKWTRSRRFLFCDE